MCLGPGGTEWSALRLKNAQARMRLSTIQLTWDLYTRLGKDDEQAAALKTLPQLSAGA